MPTFCGNMSEAVTGEDFVVFTDGSGAQTQFKPHIPAFSAAVITNEYGVTRRFVWEYPTATNNEAEYNGVIEALGVLPFGSSVKLLSDSQLVIGQLVGGWKINKVELRQKVDLVHQIISQKRLIVKFEWIPRKQNLADEIIHEKRMGMFIFRGE